MDAHRQLIVNADDLGQSDGVNLGIVEAFEDFPGQFEPVRTTVLTIQPETVGRLEAS